MSSRTSHDPLTKLVRDLLEGLVFTSRSTFLQESPMLKRTMLSRSLLLAFSSTAALSGTAAFAQQAPAEPQTLQRVEITGSAIRRTDSETPSPVQVITKA